MIAPRPDGTVSPSPPPPLRLDLAPVRAARAVMDGAWWPRTWDPLTELPDLVRALSERYGQIRQVMLNRGAWSATFRRLAIDARVVRMGWFTSLDPALVIATTEKGVQIDVLVVPPRTSDATARRAMTMAVDPANTMRAPDVLVAAAAAAVPDAVRSGSAPSDPPVAPSPHTGSQGQQPKGSLAPVGHRVRE